MLISLTLLLIFCLYYQHKTCFCLLNYLCHEMVINIFVLIHYLSHEMVINVFVLVHYLCHEMVINIFVLIHCLCHEMVINVFVLLNTLSAINNVVAINKSKILRFTGCFFCIKICWNCF